MIQRCQPRCSPPNSSRRRRGRSLWFARASPPRWTGLWSATTGSPLISAPAGFGKTTLLTDWTARLSERRTRLGWLSLDEGDNALPRFLTHVWQRCPPPVSTCQPRRWIPWHMPPITATLTALVNKTVRAGQEHPGNHWLLVLEDSHLIEAPDVHEAVTFLLDYLPEQLHLIVTTRSDRPCRCPGSVVADS